MRLDAWKITMRMYGVTALYKKSTLQPLLELLEVSDFAPLQWSKMEVGGVPYVRTEILDWIEDSVMFEAELFIKRKRVPRYTGTFRLNERPGILIEWDGKLAAKHWPSVFGLSDSLCEVFSPDIAWTHIWSPLVKVWATDQDQDKELMWRAAAIPPKDYPRQGPRGFAMRTHLGPHYLTQFGTRLIDSLPVPVEHQDWGGVRADLVENPWEAEWPDLAAAWRSAMQHVENAGVFALATCKQTDTGKSVAYTKSDRVKVEWHHERGC